MSLGVVLLFPTASLDLGVYKKPLVLFRRNQTGVVPRVSLLLATNILSSNDINDERFDQIGKGAKEKTDQVIMKDNCANAFVIVHCRFGYNTHIFIKIIKKVVLV